ncbi:MAG: site-specific integrase, partial [bacterium]|nr:site-specific integrase [bacterium]
QWVELVALRRPRVHMLRRRIEIAESATELGSGLSWGAPETHERRPLTMPAFLADRLAAEWFASVFVLPRPQCAPRCG